MHSAACNQHPQEALLSWQGPSSCPTELSSRAEQADPGSAPSGCAGQPGSQNRFVKSSAQAKEAILPFKQSREPPLPSGTRKGRCATQRGTDNESVASEHSLGHFQTGSKSPSWTPRLKHSQVFSHRHPLTRHVPRHSLDHLVICFRGSAGRLVIWLRNKELRRAALEMPLKEAYLNQGAEDSLVNPTRPPTRRPLSLRGCVCPVME